MCPKKINDSYSQETLIIRRQILNETTLETLHLVPILFHHVPGFYLETRFLNPIPLSLMATFFIPLTISKSVFPLYM